MAMCSVCNGIGCPCCWEEPKTMDCPECEGNGYIIYNDDGDLITEEEYNASPAEYFKDACDVCNGEGYIYCDLTVKYMASWGLKCATLSSQTKVN